MKLKVFIIAALLLAAGIGTTDLVMSNPVSSSAAEIKWPRHKHHHHARIRLHIFPLTHHVRQIVFVCADGSDNLFHRNLTCIKLNECKGSIVSMTRNQARVSGRHKCSLCY